MKTLADCRCLLNKSHYHYKIKYIYKTLNVVSTMCLAFMLSHFSHVWLSWDPMDYSPPGSSVHGILQTRILDWVAMPFSRVLCALRYAKRFSNISSMLITVLIRTLQWSLFYLWRTRHKKIISLPKVTQLVSGRNWIQIQVAWLQNPCFYLPHPPSINIRKQTSYYLGSILWHWMVQCLFGILLTQSVF